MQVLWWPLVLSFSSDPIDKKKYNSSEYLQLALNVIIRKAVKVKVVN